MRKRKTDGTRKSPNQEKSLTREHNDKRDKRLKKIVTAVCAAALVVVILVAAVALLVKVDNISVEGNTEVPDNEIIDASGLSVNRSLLLQDYFGYEKKITRRLSYITAASLSFEPMGKLIINVTEAEPEYFVKIADSEDYALCDDINRVLSIGSGAFPKGAFLRGVTLPEVYETQDADARLAEIIGQKDKEMAGLKNSVSALRKKNESERTMEENADLERMTEEVAALDEEIISLKRDQELLRLKDRLMELCKREGIADITEIDLTDVRSIKIEIKGLVTVVLGGESDLESRIGYVMRSVERELSERPDTPITLDLTFGDFGVARNSDAIESSLPKYTVEESTEDEPILFPYEPYEDESEDASEEESVADEAPADAGEEASEA